jgi:hypothetical protein
MFRLILMSSFRHSQYIHILQNSHLVLSSLPLYWYDGLTKTVRIQLLYVADCLSVESARSNLKNSLARVTIDTVVEAFVGDYTLIA